MANKTSMATTEENPTDLSQDVAELKALIGLQSEQHAAEVAELRGLISSLSTAPQSLQSGQFNPASMANDIAAAMTESKKRANKTTEKLAKIQAHIDLQKTHLLEGARQFSVRIPGNPQERVGGFNEVDVQQKYMAYYGIRAIINPNIRCEVEELSAAA